MKNGLLLVKMYFFVLNKGISEKVRQIAQKHTASRTDSKLSEIHNSRYMKNPYTSVNYDRNLYASVNLPSETPAY